MSTDENQLIDVNDSIMWPTNVFGRYIVLCRPPPHLPPPPPEKKKNHWLTN